MKKFVILLISYPKNMHFWVKKLLLRKDQK